MPEDVSGFEYRRLPNGIHVLAFRDYSEQTFEECFACFEAIFLNNPPDQVIRLMVDIRHVQVLSLPPIISLVRQIMDSRSLLPPVAVAIVHDRRGYYVAFSGLVVRLAAFYKARVRVGDDYDECYTWLESLQ